jgi:hypothetical protein
MFSIDQKKAIREEFWQEFKTFSNLRKLRAKKAGKWIMGDTGIKQLILKFHFDENIAFAGIEINTRNLDKRIELYDKLEKLKSVLIAAVPHPLQWELEASTETGQPVSRVYASIPNVSIYDRNCWQKVFRFLYEVMDPIESVFSEYKDFLKY